ncbi:hypothetical protein [Pseudactinotalea sp. Z1732]|uniref:hypothetical protein n=1 Tax=Micrococcales TaxID=85006 RepID=UPI003C7B6D5D
MGTTTRTLSINLPLPVPVDMEDYADRPMTATAVQYQTILWPDGHTVRVTTVFADDASNRSIYTLTDLPHGIPDAPQWYLDAADAMVAELAQVVAS